MFNNLFKTIAFFSLVSSTSSAADIPVPETRKLYVHFENLNATPPPAEDYIASTSIVAAFTSTNQCDGNSINFPLVGEKPRLEFSISPYQTLNMLDISIEGWRYEIRGNSYHYYERTQLGRLQLTNLNNYPSHLVTQKRDYHLYFSIFLGDNDLGNRKYIIEEALSMAIIAA